MDDARDPKPPTERRETRGAPREADEERAPLGGATERAIIEAIAREALDEAPTTSDAAQSIEREIERLAADLVLDGHPGATVPELALADLLREIPEPPTQPIDMAGFQESPLPTAEGAAGSAPARAPWDRAPRIPLPRFFSSLPNGSGPHLAPIPASLLEASAESAPVSPAEKNSGPPSFEGRPSTVLVVDNDLAEGASMAAGLLERGYVCQVVTSDGAEPAIARQPFDALILEIRESDPNTKTWIDALEKVRGHRGVLILTSSEEIPGAALRSIPRPVTSLTRPFPSEALVRSVESARGANVAAADPLEPPERQPRDETIHSLDASPIRVVIQGPDRGQIARGRLRSLSLSGEAVVADGAVKARPEAVLTADIPLTDGRTTFFHGRIVASSGPELRLKLDMDEGRRKFLAEFLEEALSPAARRLQPIRVTVRSDGTGGGLLDDVALMRKWVDVAGDLDDHAAHQRFIQDCVRGERLEFAVARYRDFKAQHPEDERASKYLHQIGTILSVSAIQKKELSRIEAKRAGSSLRVSLVLFALAALGLLLILRLTAQ